jgi:paraquat-inducible protein B
MATKANPATIGAFVVGALALAVTGAVVFGSGKLFRQTMRAVCFFTGDVSGLRVGAPVQFKGVDVGEVADIRLRIGEEQGDIDPELVRQGMRIPVIVEIDSERMAARGARRLDRERVKYLIDLGLRAQLAAQSLVTGLLVVKLDFLPEMPPTYVLPSESTLIEIPTIPTSLQQAQAAFHAVVRKLDQIDLERLVTTTSEAIDGIRTVVRSPGLQRAVDMLPETLTSVNQAVASVRDLARRFDSGQGPLLQSLRETSDKSRDAVDQARLTLEALRGLTDPNAPLAVDLTAALREVTAAARSVRLLADYIERNPSAIVRGREARE